MGLTTCPECGETISEKAGICPHCNANIVKRNLVVCEDCQQEYNMKMVTCPYCGCPNPSAKQRKKKHKAIITSVIVLALIAVIIFSIGVSQQVKEVEYYKNMETASYSMLDGAVKAETAGNLIKSVWYNAIYEKRDNETNQYTMKNGKFVDDFNDALSNLFADENFGSSIYQIEVNQSEVTELMRRLKNPPKKYEEAYSVLLGYYENYLKMTKAVINPTGSLNTFSEEFDIYDTNTADSFEKMRLYLK